MYGQCVEMFAFSTVVLYAFNSYRFRDPPSRAPFLNTFVDQFA